MVSNKILFDLSADSVSRRNISFALFEQYMDQSDQRQQPDSTVDTSNKLVIWVDALHPVQLEAAPAE